MINVTYLNTFYNRLSIDRVFGNIRFVNRDGETYIEYACMGHTYEINCKYVVSIEQQEEE